MSQVDLNNVSVTSSLGELGPTTSLQLMFAKLQLELAETAARQALPLGDRLEAAPWMGRRPTLPDCRPIIGPMPGRRGLWLAFGHQHVGFSTGTGTAKLLGALMSKQAAPINAKPFRAERFL